MNTQRAIETVLESVGSSPSSVARALEVCWKGIFQQMTPEVREELAYTGLSTLIHAELNRRRSSPVVRRMLEGGIVLHMPEPKVLETPVIVFSRVSYQGADGFEKPILKFTSADFDVAVSRMESQVRGMQERIDFFKVVQQEMREKTVLRMEDLPSSVLEDLAVRSPFYKGESEGPDSISVVG